MTSILTKIFFFQIYFKDLLFLLRCVKYETDKEIKCENIMKYIKKIAPFLIYLVEKMAQQSIALISRNYKPNCFKWR